MAFPDYASTGLPTAVLVGTWKEAEPYQDNVTSDMAGGNKRKRAYPGDELKRITFNIKYTQAQFLYLKDTFIKTTLGLGVSRFYMLVWNGKQYENRLVQISTRIQNESQPPTDEIVTWDLWVYP